MSASIILNSTTIGTNSNINLNYNIIRIQNEDSYPSDNVIPNTIAVITDIPLGVHQFLSDEPAKRIDGSALMNGDIWIKTGSKTASGFSTLKDIGIFVYPLLAYQYQNGSFVPKVAKSYIDGNWRTWMLMLYDVPDQFGEFTGGWVAAPYGSHGTATITAAGITLGNNAGTSSGGIGGIAGTNSMVNLLGYKRLGCTVSAITGIPSGYIGLFSSRLWHTGNFASTVNNTVSTFYVNIPNGLTSAYITMITGMVVNTSRTITKIWLE